MMRLSPYQLFALILSVWAALAASAQAQMPTKCSQAIIGIADGWNSSHVKLSLVEKNKAGQWVRTFGPIPGRLGNKGLVWGLGLHTNPKGATIKREGDGRSPAGIFAIGGLWTTTKTPVKHHPRIPEVRVGPRDLWVSDTATPKLYNRYVRLDHPASTPWELKEQMRQTIDHHSVKMLICHNTAETPGRPVLGAGSAIFFHIWYLEGTAATAGCTAMSEPNLRAFISRLDPSRMPVYILLPQAEYSKLRQVWRLP